MNAKIDDLILTNIPRRLFRGISVAFVGMDGAGKTTVINCLREQWPDSTRLVVMGAAIDQANYCLPTSRWLMSRKRRKLKATLKNPDVVPPARLLSDEQRRQLQGGRLIKVIGMINRIADEWYRYLVIASMKALGFVVLCDRYFLFEHDLHESHSGGLMTVRIHNWILKNLYPRPNLVIFLEADPEFLIRRKPEWPVEHLQHQRNVINEQSNLVPNFVRVDATQPLDSVLASVRSLISEQLDL